MSFKETLISALEVCKKETKEKESLRGVILYLRGGQVIGGIFQKFDDTTVTLCIEGDSYIETDADSTSVLTSYDLVIDLEDVSGIATDIGC